jgi:hypothetical protein
MHLADDGFRIEHMFQDSCGRVMEISAESLVSPLSQALADRQGLVAS